MQFNITPDVFQKLEMQLNTNGFIEAVQNGNDCDLIITGHHIKVSAIYEEQVLTLVVVGASFPASLLPADKLDDIVQAEVQKAINTIGEFK